MELIKSFYCVLILFFLHSCTTKPDDWNWQNQGDKNSSDTLPKVIPDINNFYTWENFIGHTGWSTTYAWTWRRIARHSRINPATSTTDFNTMKTILSSNNLMYGANTTMPGANDCESDPIFLANFLNAIESDNGLQHYKDIKAQANSLILARDLAGWSDAKIYWQLGNEINNKIFSTLFKNWANTNGKPYPHPNSTGEPGKDFETGVDNVITSTDQGYIGYMLEYCVAPAIKALNEINASLPDNKKIIIMTGSLANSRGKDNRNWMNTVINYKFAGTYVPEFKDKRLYELIDGVTHHYLFGEYRQFPDPSNDGLTRHEVLKSMFDLWTDTSKPNNRIKYIYTTEEIGGKCSSSGRAAYHAVIVALSYVDFFQKYGIEPAKGRGIFYGVEATTTGVNKNFVSGAFGLNYLEYLIPNRTLIRRPDILVSENNPLLEKYAFVTDKNEVLIAFHTPSPSSVSKPSPQDVSSIKINLPGIDNYEVLKNGAYLFTIDEFIKPTVTTSLNGRIMELVIKSGTSRSNNSVVVNSNGIITRFNGTLIVKLVKSTK